MTAIQEHLRGRKTYIVAIALIVNGLYLMWTGEELPGTWATPGGGVDPMFESLVGGGLASLRAAISKLEAGLKS